MFTSNKKKSIRKKQLCHSFQPSDFLQLEDHCQFSHKKGYQYADKQNVAKQILIQIGESQHCFQDLKPSQTVPLSIDRWIIGSNSHRNNANIQKCQTKNFLFVRNVRSVTSGLTKERNGIQSNTMSKLKQALKKLESPQKLKSKKIKSKQVNKNQMIEVLNNKRKIQTKVSDLIKLKQTENLKTSGTSSHFQARKISTSMQSRKKKTDGLWLPPQPLDTKKMNELFNYTCKQSRKNRTLKSILN